MASSCRTWRSARDRVRGRRGRSTPDSAEGGTHMQGMSMRQRIRMHGRRDRQAESGTRGVSPRRLSRNVLARPDRRSAHPAAASTPPEGAALSGWSHDEPQRVSSAGLSSPVSSSLRSRSRLRMRLGLAAMALVVVRAAPAIVPPTLPSDSGIRASSGRSAGRSSR